MKVLNLPVILLGWPLPRIFRKLIPVAIGENLGEMNTNSLKSSCCKCEP